MTSIFDENSNEIIELHKSYLRSLSFILLLFIANIIISYNINDKLF